MSPEGIELTTYIGLFAKHWTPGRTKTRLAESVGEITAAECSKRFLTATIRRLQPMGDDFVLAYSPSTKRPEFEELIKCVSVDCKLASQCEGDLGNRMQGFFETAFEKGAEIVILLGSDSPDFPAESLQEGIDWLMTKSSDDRALFLGPSNDGGYWSVGMRQSVAPIFADMPWSEPSLMEATLARLKELNWKEGTDFLLIDTWYDVDHLQDLKLLEDRLDGRVKRDDALEDLLKYIRTI